MFADQGYFKMARDCLTDMKYAFIFPDYKNLLPEDHQLWDNATPEEREAFKQDH